MSRENSRDCDLVQDLLPLYLDDACSASSKKVVEEHLAECAACREVVQKLKDHTVEDVIAAESESVLAHHAKRERTAAFKAGVIIAGLLIVYIPNIIHGQPTDGRYQCPDAFDRAKWHWKRIDDTAHLHPDHPWCRPHRSQYGCCHGQACV